MSTAARLKSGRIIIGIYLMLLTYDGLLRRWLFPSIEQIVFVLKDFVLLAGCVIAYDMTVWRMLPPPVVVLFIAYAVWVVIGALNPFLPSVLVGLLGIKAHILYAGLVIILPGLWRGVDEMFASISRIFPWLVVPVCILGIVQVNSPQDSGWNQNFDGTLEGFATFGDQGLIRVYGPFSYISGMASFLSSIGLLGVGLYLWGQRSIKFLAALLFLSLSIPITGSRAVLANLAVGGLVMLIAGTVVRAISVGRTINVLLGCTLLVAASYWLQPQVWEAMLQRIGTTFDEENRALRNFTRAFDYPQAGWAGYGTGSANLGAPALVPERERFDWLPPFDFEEESGRLVIELGMIGWLLSLALRLANTLWCLFLLVMGHTRSIRCVASIVLAFMLLSLQSGTGVFGASYAAQSYWFCLALLVVATREHMKQTQFRRSIKIRVPEIV